MAVRAMAGSILAGWAVEAWRSRPARWRGAGCWAVGQTDRGSGGGGSGMGGLHGVRGGQERWMRAALPAGGGGGLLVDGEQAAADPGDDGHGDGVADGAVAGGVGDRQTVGVQWVQSSGKPWRRSRSEE